METEKTILDVHNQHSDQVQDVLGTPPSYLLMIGSSVLLLFVFGLLFISWFIKYPDIIGAQVIITTRKPPTSIVAKVSGRLQSLFVKDNEIVQASQDLGLLENPANYNDVRILCKSLDSIKENLLLPKSLLFSAKFVLGEIQLSYSNFMAKNRIYLVQKNINPQSREIRDVIRQIKENKNLLKKLEGQEQLAKKELSIVEHDFDRTTKLYQEKVLSDKDYEDKERELIQTKKIYLQSTINVSNTKINLASLQRTLGQIEIQENILSDGSYHECLAALNDLKVAIKNWENKYLLRSPIIGRVSFFNVWSEDQFVKYEEEVFTIVPINEDGIFGRLSIPLLNSGKVKVGQNVKIRLENYPYEEYGLFIGKVKSISLVPKQKIYSIEVDLTNGLKSTYGKQIPFGQELQGSAEIVTQDLRLIERIFYSIKKVFANE